MRSVAGAFWRQKSAKFSPETSQCLVARVGAVLAPHPQATLTSSTNTEISSSQSQNLLLSNASPYATHLTHDSLCNFLSNGSSATMIAQQTRGIVVETNQTPNPDSLRFFSMEISFLPEGQSMDMPNKGHAYKSPLAEILFELEGVKALYFGDEYITVTKESDADWAELGTHVKEAITQFAESGVSILSAEGEEQILPLNWDTDPATDDSEVVLAIKELLASRIRPMVQGDGGNVRFIGFDEADGMVFVMLEGACKSCPSSGQTLKFGIERMLMHWIPEVTEVQEVDEEFAADYKRQQTEAKEKKEKENAAAESKD